MELRRSQRPVPGSLFAQERAISRRDQEKLEARIAQAKDEVQRALSLFNEHMAGLAQTIMAIQAELSRARQGSWAPQHIVDALSERLEITEHLYAEVDRERQRLVVDPLRMVEQTELRLQEARRRTEISLAAAEADDALERLRDSLAEALMLADARTDLMDRSAAPADYPGT